MARARITSGTGIHTTESPAAEQQNPYMQVSSVDYTGEDLGMQRAANTDSLIQRPKSRGPRESLHMPPEETQNDDEHEMERFDVESSLIKRRPK